MIEKKIKKTRFEVLENTQGESISKDMNKCYKTVAYLKSIGLSDELAHCIDLEREIIELFNMRLEIVNSGICDRWDLPIDNLIFGLRKHFDEVTLKFFGGKKNKNTESEYIFFRSPIGPIILNSSMNPKGVTRCPQTDIKPFFSGLLVFLLSLPCNRAHMVMRSARITLRKIEGRTRSGDLLRFEDQTVIL